MPAPPDGLRVAIADLCRDLAGQLPAPRESSDDDWTSDHTWRRDPDSYLRQHVRRYPQALRRLIRPETAPPGFGSAVEALRRDSSIAPQLDTLIGVEFSATRVDADRIVRSLVYDMVDDDGVLNFNGERFERRWGEMSAVFDADELIVKLIAPLPGLTLPHYPVQIDSAAALDTLTDSELNSCFAVGLLQPSHAQSPMLDGHFAVGLRYEMRMPKRVGGSDPTKLPSTIEEGPFGDRPPLSAYRIVDDVLTVLRLGTSSRFWSPGSVTNLDMWASGIGGSVDSRAALATAWAFPPTVAALSDEEVAQVTHLWQETRTLLSTSNKRTRAIDFALRRFNSSFDRRNAEDRLIDLLIAAESVFLQGKRDELSFRLAVRAATFADDLPYSRSEVFATMRDAYKERSSIVHGEASTTDALSGIVAITEEIMRAALRKAISLLLNGDPLRSDEYWDRAMLDQLRWG